LSEQKTLKLKKGEDRRIRGGHLWVFSNEIDTRATPLTAFEAGEQALVLASDDRKIGVVYVNPASLISARIVTRDPSVAFDRSLITHRLKIALSLRERLYDDHHYRLVFGEADGLPGLIVDRYGDVAVVQITTAGMELRKDEILAALDKVIKPAGVLWRNDAAVRELEGLERYVEVASGDVPSELEVSEGGVKFGFSPHKGQKTGWFYDQRSNRDRLAAYVAEKRVLDVYSYVGAWGLRALAGGASSVTCVDTSPRAIEEIQKNAEANGFGDRVTAVQSDGLQYMREARDSAEKFDVVVLDPPAFVKRKKDLKQGSIAYRRINEQAMRLLNRDGILVTCSCSYHMPEDLFIRNLQQAARHLDRQVQILEVLQQGMDHPVHPAIPETRYLKGVIARVLPA
jgi:23S rRNA (cytosine1962-C5)-methyltransferase